MNDLVELIENSQKLLNNGRDIHSLTTLRQRLLSSESALNTGGLLSPGWGRKHLGETYERVILASEGIETNLKELEEYTVLGGWCTLRTFDTVRLSKGILTDPVSNQTYPFSSIYEVTEWMKSNISLDQIVETVGPYAGDKYAAISEVKLWTNKISTIFEERLGDKLSSQEKSHLALSVEYVESKKYIFTKRYLEYLANKPVTLTRIVDQDIFDELVHGRDCLLQMFDLSIEDLARPTLERAKLVHSELQKKKFEDYIRDYSISWFFYTGEYLRILQKNNYVATPKALLINPWKYALNSEIEGKQIFYQKVFNNDHVYLKENGINENIGFVAIDQPSTFGMKRLRTHISMAAVPNSTNYKKYLTSLRGNQKLNYLDISQNQAFLDIINFFPYRNGAKLLMEMIDTVNDYKSKHKNTSKKDVSYQLSLRNQYSDEIYKISHKMINELEKLFDFIFQDSSD